MAALLSCLLAPSPILGQTCTGDCDGDGTVTVDEIVTALNIGLGIRPVTDCVAADSSGDGSVTVDEIVTALTLALDGCTAVAPTATATPTATPSPPSAGTIRIDVGSGSGLPGAVVRIPVTLSGGADTITAVSSDITYDTTDIRVVRIDDLACAINPDIGAGTVPDKMLISNVLPADGSRETVRVGVIAFTNALPIPDGLVFTCDFRIMPAAPAGEVVLENLPGASDANGNAPPVVGSDGTVTVR